MARKENKGSSSGGSGFLVFAVIIIVFVVIITPIILIIGVIWETYASIRIKRGFTGSISDFWLSDTEKSEFVDTCEKLSGVMDILKKVELAVKEEGIGRNTDGTITARGKKGKELRAIEDKQIPIFNTYVEKYENLSNAPHWRRTSFYEELTSLYKTRRGYVAGFFSWIIGLHISIFYFTQVTIDSVGKYKSALARFYDFPGLACSFKASSTDWYIALATTGFTLFVFYITQKLKVSLNVPEVPVVTVENFNDY